MNSSLSQTLSALDSEIGARQRAASRFSDFCRYVAPHEPPDRHHELICDEIDRIVSGENKRLILMMPPGSAKSTYATVRAPVYYLGKTGRKGIICASHNEDLATSFGRKVRNLVAEAVTQAVFPNLALAEDQRARGE